MIRLEENTGTTMKTIEISEQILTKCPGLSLGCIEAEVKVETDRSDLWTHIDTELEKFGQGLEVKEVNQRPTIAGTRIAYKACGKDPSRYRPSAEALTRRIAQGKGLYRVNNLVDLLNLVSIQSGFSIGGFDLDPIIGDTALKIAAEGEPYEAIGRGQLNIAGLPAMYDDLGPFGTPTSDSVRTMVRPETNRFLMVFYAFSNSDLLPEFILQASSLLEKFASAKHLNYKTLSK